jgi:hypothetical protein
VEQSPGVDRHSTRTAQASAWSAGAHRVLTAGPNATGTHLSRCGQVERHRCSEGAEPGNRNRRSVQTRSGVLRHAGQPPRLGVGVGGADQPPPVRSGTLQMSVSADSGSGRIGDRPSGRGEHAAMRAWPATAGGSGRTASAAATRNPGPQSGKKRDVHWLVPPAHGGVCGLSGRNTGRGLRHRLRCTEAVARQAFGSATEQAPAGSTIPADAASAGFASVRRRHEPSLDARASARSDRGGGRQRQEGNGRSDAVRLSTRGMLRRV